MIHITDGDVAQLVRQMGLRISQLPNSLEKGIYGIPRGGIHVAAQVAKYLNAEQLRGLVDGCVVVDDLVDSGRTLALYSVQGYPVDALIRKPHSPRALAPHAREMEGWVVFPWEEEQESEGPVDAVIRLLEFIGEDPNREGLQDTPGRVLRAFKEMTEGRIVDVAPFLQTTFQETYDEIIAWQGIRFTSLCEHHLLPFVGTVSLGYIPKGRVVGLSKAVRVVRAFAKRLQTQERMTFQIAKAFETHLSALGVGVVTRAKHSCMACRGVLEPDSEVVTSAMFGVFRDKPEARAELLELLR